MTDSEKNLLLSRIDEALNHVRPHLAIDGGDIRVIDVSDDMIVSIEWLGNCQNCSMTTLTMKAGIEDTLNNKMPEIKGVLAIN